MQENLYKKGSKKAIKRKKLVDNYNVITPLYYTAKVCGLWPQTLKKSPASASILNIFYVFFLYAFYVYVFYNTWDKDYWEQFQEITQSYILYMGSYAQLQCGLLLGMIYILCNLLHHRKLWKIIDLLNDVDRGLVQQFQMKINHAMLYNLSMIVATSVHCLIFLLLTTDYIIYEVLLELRNRNIYVAHFLSNHTYTLLISIYTFLLLTYKRRFAIINNLLTLMIPVEEQKQNVSEKAIQTISVSHKEEVYIQFNEIISVYMKNSKDDLNLQNVLDQNANAMLKDMISKAFNTDSIHWETIKAKEKLRYIREINKLHDTLCDGIKLINEAFSFQILLTITWGFIFAIFALFSTYRTVFDTNGKASIIAFLNAYWICFYGAILVALTAISSHVLNSARDAGRILHRLINKTANRELQAELNIISRQFNSRRPLPSCGLFPFDFTLLYSVFSAGSLYFIFLIQFDVMDNRQLYNVSRIL